MMVAGSSFRTAAAALALLTVVIVCACLGANQYYYDEIDSTTELAVLSNKQRTEKWFAPLAPMHQADNVYLYWGSDIDKYASARVVHSNLVLRHMPQYINNLGGARFRGLSLTCCNVVVFPPFAHGFPVYADQSPEATRIARFVAEGNTAIFTGSLTDVLFINTYFHTHMETVKGTYSAGPYPKRFHRLPLALQGVFLPSKLHQVNVQATVISKFSLPEGAVIIYDDLQGGTPVFMIKYCMVNNPKIGEPPFKVHPASCKKWEKRGNPCGCGNIIYIGFDYKDTNEKEWNLLLRNLINFAAYPSHPPPPKDAVAAKKAKH